MEIVSKGEFAARLGVSPGRVSQYIAEGKISGDALVGEGRSARIAVEAATAQLRAKLDINQRFGLNGVSTRIDAAPVEQPVSAPASVPPPSDPVEDRIKREKLRQAELMTARLEREDREAHGQYIRASEAREQMSRIAGTMMTMFEGALPELAGAVAAQFELPGRDVLHLMRQEFRRIRDRASASRKEASAAEPATIEDPIEHAG